MRLLNEVIQHLLGDFEVGDHTVLQRANGNDVSRRPPQHVFGFFPDSFRRKVVDVDYYKAMGEYAYGSLSRSEHDTVAEVFRELAVKFVGFMDVLALVSERTHSGLPVGGDTLRLYEKWLRTGSVRDGQRLVERGVVPNQSIGSTFLQ